MEVIPNLNQQRPALIRIERGEKLQPVEQAILFIAGGYMTKKLKTFHVTLFAILSFSGYLAYIDPDFRQDNLGQIAYYCLCSCIQIKEDDDDETDRHDKNDKNGKDSRK
jgi:hypothetical protein